MLKAQHKAIVLDVRDTQGTYLLQIVDEHGKPKYALGEFLKKEDAERIANYINKLLQALN
jgi:hypothetical protein